MFATASNFHPSLIFVGKAGNVTIRVESCKGCYSGKLQPCISLGEKLLAEVNTLAYYATLTIMAVKVL